MRRVDSGRKAFRGVCIAVALLAPAMAVHAGLAAPDGRFTERGTVVKVVDGDTLDVRIARKTERVRVIGIDTPERGACHYTEASSRTSALALGKSVVLRGDATQDTRDRYGRLLAYVQIGNVDLGLRLVQEGFATVYVFRTPFVRLNAYKAAAASATDSKAVARAACARSSGSPATTTSPSPVTAAALPVPTPATSTTPAASQSRSGCDPAYPTVCIPPAPPDLDCGQISFRNFRVSPPDPHGFDGRDNDGLGCES